jgi:hypothetical protein
MEWFKWMEWLKCLQLMEWLQWLEWLRRAAGLGLRRCRPRGAGRG